MESLVGKRFGSWLVTERGEDVITYPPSRGRRKVSITYICRCSCLACEQSDEPVVSVVYKEKLVHGRSLSCGRAQPKPECLVDGCAEDAYSQGYCSPHWYRFDKYGDPLRSVNERHGRSSDLAYKTWSNMISHCTNIDHPSWKNYGGAHPPVVVCERWMGIGEKHSGGFVAFLDDMGEMPSIAHQIHRVDNVPLYSPETCVWIEKSEHRRLHLRHPLEGGSEPE